MQDFYDSLKKYCKQCCDDIKIACTIALIVLSNIDQHNDYNQALWGHNIVWNLF